MVGRDILVGAVSIPLIILCTFATFARYEQRWKNPHAGVLVGCIEWIIQVIVGAFLFSPLWLGLAVVGGLLGWAFWGMTGW